MVLVEVGLELNLVGATHFKCGFVSMQGGQTTIWQNLVHSVISNRQY